MPLIIVRAVLIFNSKTEIDFAEIAGAGLNWVRIPLPWWAIEVREIGRAHV